MTQSLEEIEEARRLALRATAAGESLIPSIGIPASWLGGVIGRHEMDPNNPDPVDRSLGAEALPMAEREAAEDNERARFARERGEIPIPAITSEEAAQELSERKRQGAENAMRIQANERLFEERERIRGRLRELSETAPLARGMDRAELMDPQTAVQRRQEAQAAFADRDADRARQIQIAAARGLQDLPIPPRLTAALAGGLQGGTFGGGDELMGLGAAVLTGDNYERARDAFRAISDEARELDPAAYDSAQVATSIGTGLAIPGGNAGRALTLSGAMARGAATGGAWGLLNGFLGSEGDGAEETIQDAAEAGTFGALVGGPLGALGHGFGKVADWAAERIPGMRSAAARQRAAALGANARDIEAANRHFPGGIEGLADEFRGMGLTGAARTPQSFERPAEEALRSSGRAMGEILGEARAAQSRGLPSVADRTAAGRPGALRQAAQSAQGMRLSVPEFRAQVEEALLAPLSRGTTNTARGQRQAITQWLDNVAEAYPDGIGVDELQGLKRELQDAIFMNRRDPGAGATAQAYNALQQHTRGSLDQMLDDIGQRINDPDMMERFRSARRRSHAAHLADEWIGNATNRASANNVMQPLAEVRAAAGAAAGDSGGGLLQGIARQLLRDRQHSLAATALEGMANRAGTAPERARVLTEALRSRSAPVVGRIGAELTGTDQPDPPPVDPNTADPNTLSDEEWLQLMDQPQAETAEPQPNPDEMTDEEWLELMEQPQ